VLQLLDELIDFLVLRREQLEDIGGGVFAEDPTKKAHCTT
jgi:hypothetical protein